MARAKRVGASVVVLLAVVALGVVGWRHYHAGDADRDEGAAAAPVPPPGAPAAADPAAPAAAAAVPADLAHVEGTVRDALTGEPLAGIDVVFVAFPAAAPPHTTPPPRPHP